MENSTEINFEKNEYKVACFFVVFIFGAVAAVVSKTLGTYRLKNFQII